MDFKSYIFSVEPMIRTHNEFLDQNPEIRPTTIDGHLETDNEQVTHLNDLSEVRISDDRFQHRWIFNEFDVLRDEILSHSLID